MLKQKITYFFLFFPILLFCEVFESNTISSILNHIENNTIVIADLDNTLIESQSHLGSSQWGDHLGAVFSESGISIEEVDLLVGDLWFQVQPQIKIKCVDPETSLVINKLHEQKIPFIGLTARRPAETHYTLEQLSSVNICASKGFFDEGFLEGFTSPRKGITCHEGIIFCTPINKKSMALQLYLEKLQVLPKKIIFIDDKMHHVKDIEKLAESLGIKYTGIRFSGSDERVKAFCPKIAKIQFDNLPTILSDEEAALILR